MSQKLREPKIKAGRRGNNEGSIFQRKDGRWCGQVITGYKTDGKPIRKPVYGHSRQEVAQKVAAQVTEVNKQGYTSVSARDERNFQVLMSEWFDLFATVNMASVTEVNRRGMLKNHIYPAFGAYDVQNITLEMLQRFFNAKVKDGVSPDTVNKLKNLIKNFLSYAVKKGFTRENYMLDVVIKKREVNNTEDEEKALRPEIRQRIFELVVGHNLLKPILITSTLTGLRPQEIIALEWRHLDLDRKILSVKQALNRVYDIDAEGTVTDRREEVGKTKTPKSVQDIMLPDTAVNALKEWANYCKEHNIVSQYVFPNTETGGLRTYSGLRSLLTRFIKKHGLEAEGISLYTFRHTFATVSLEQRENPRIVADLMGHVKVSTTLDIYSHVVSNSVYEKTAQTLDGVFAAYL